MSQIHQINVKPKIPSERGLPKTSVEHVFVSKIGLEGDHNNFRSTKKNNDPDMAVLVYPIETIHELNKEGWPIMPGDLGENFTLFGIPHSHFSPNQQYKIGTCIIEISFECEPCKNLSVLPYIGDQKVKQFVKTLIHRRGWFARVINEGWIEKGNSIEQIK